MAYRKVRSMAGFVVFAALLQIFAMLLVVALISPDGEVPFTSYAHQVLSP